MKSANIWSIFWFIFSRIRTEYGGLRTKSLKSVLIRENTGLKTFRNLYYKRKATSIVVLSSKNYRNFAIRAHTQYYKKVQNETSSLK